MRLIDRITGSQPAPKRSIGSLMDVYGFNGNLYPLTTTYTTGKNEPPPNDFRGYSQVYKSNPVVFACLATRLALFTEARFAFRRMRNGIPQDLFGTEDLRVLEHPDAGTTTSDLLARMEQDASLAGNSYHARIGDPTRPRASDRIVRLKPQHVTIVLGTPNSGVDDPSDDPEVRVIGYVYDPKKGGAPRSFLPDQVAHYKPTTDPEANFRGMSWLTPVIREIQADNSATDFKSQFYDHAATSNMVVTVDKEAEFETFQRFKDDFNLEHQGALNAYKTIFLGGGADVKVVGTNFVDMAYTAVQQAGENRICIAANVPAVMVGVESGLDSATYSNMGIARRIFSDTWGRPAWRDACGALEVIVPPPGDARLDVDVDNIAFLRDDGKDIAEIQKGQAAAIKGFVDSGFVPESAVEAVTANDLTRLRHSGLLPVQVQPPGTGNAGGSTNGNNASPASQPA